ncbi:hypothetical protein SRO_4251 [Streptomyces rochei]|nr:hypothetical protein SRO_4251 [Streptomyces rochei]
MEKDGTEVDQGRHDTHEDGSAQPRSQSPDTPRPLGGQGRAVTPLPRRRAGIGPSAFPHVR